MATCTSKEMASPEDRTAIVNKLRKAAEQGDARAQLKLGQMYQFGDYPGITADQAEAEKWYRKAAEQFRKRGEEGDAEALIELGDMYKNSHGYGFSNGQGPLARPDSAEAAKWWCKATELFRKRGEEGDAEALYRLGDMHRTGKGVPRDYAEAAKWYRKAAEQGYRVIN